MSEAAVWYESRVEGLGDRFLDVVRTTVRRVVETPMVGARWNLPRLTTEVRRRSVAGFPYFVVYVVKPSLVIVAVAHMRRKPGYWRGRIPS